AFQLHVAAEGNHGEPQVGVSPLEAGQAGAEAEREDVDPHPEGLGGDEVAELVEEDDDAEDQDEGRGCGEMVHHEGCRTWRACSRAHASAASTSPSFCTGCGRCASMTARMDSGMAVKGMRSPRKAATA